MNTIYRQMFIRNSGLLSDGEQELLSNTTIAIAGAGGDGGLLAERLVRFGIGKIILADPEVFEINNCNRQFAADHTSFGCNKAKVIAEYLLKINPSLKVDIYTQGVTTENVNEFVDKADVIIDEIEFSLPAVSVLLHRECRRKGKYVFMGANLGWGASISCFEPGGSTFEEQFEYNEKDATINPLKYLKEKPAYISDDIISEILAGNIAVPALSSSVGLVAGILSAEVIFFITGKREPVVAPSSIYVDLFDLTIQKF